MKIDWSDDNDGPVMRAGCYLAEVVTAEEKRAKTSGNPMISLRWVAVDHGRQHLAWDNLLLGGKGKGIGLRRLEALGVERGTKNIDVNKLVGRQCYIHLVEEEYQGKKKLAVALDRGTHMGYSAQKPDVGVIEQETPSNVGDDFFSPSEDEGGDVPF